jgi:hypothetical protein
VKFGADVRTNERTHSIDIPPKSTGFGADVNGGELLFSGARLATCYCSTVYREAAKKGAGPRNAVRAAGAADLRTRRSATAADKVQI